MSDRTAVWVRFEWPLQGRDFAAPLAEGCEIRTATDNDLSDMRALVARAYASDPAWAGLTTDIERRVTNRIRARIADSEAYFPLATVEGVAVGLNGVALSSPTGMNLITGICVDPAHQGRGLGTALLGRSLAWLRGKGLPVATVITDERAVAARVYDRFGAVRTPNVSYSDAPRET